MNSGSLTLVSLKDVGICELSSDSSQVIEAHEYRDPSLVNASAAPNVFIHIRACQVVV